MGIRFFPAVGEVEPTIGLRSGDISPYVIITNDNHTVSQVAKHLSGARMVTPRTETNMWGWPIAPIYVGEYQGLKVTAACTTIGSGNTSTIMEELINAGAKILVQVGLTGALQPDIELGDIVIPVGAVRDEGTSPYYFPLNYPALADYRLIYCQVKAASVLGLKFHVGIVRTADGLYPSYTDEYAEKWRKLGVLCAEQEVSTIMIVGSHRHVVSGATLGVVDNAVTGKALWRGDVQKEQREEIFQRVIRINLETLKLMHETFGM
jgi:uridine phosphorylase